MIQRVVNILILVALVAMLPGSLVYGQTCANLVLNPTTGLLDCVGATGAGTGDFSTNTAVSVDGEIVLFSGTGGKTGKRATQTGVATVTSGVLGVVAGAGTNCVLVNGSSSACGGSAVLPFAATRETTSTTNDTIRINCDTAPYCPIQVNSITAFTASADITAQLSGTSNTNSLYIYYTPSTNTVYCDENTTATLTVSGCTAASTGGIPAGSIPLGKTTGTYAFTANAFADPSTSPQRPAVSWSNVENGDGVSCVTNGTTGLLTCSRDLAVVPSITDIRNGVHISVADTSSSSTTYTGCPAVPIGSYTSGMPIQFKPGTTNSGSSTLNLCTLGNVTIQKLVSGTLTNLSSGDMDSDSWHYMIYNGTVFVKIPLEGSSGGSSPLTTKGDLYTYSTTNDRLGIGSNGQVLSADSTASTGNKWTYVTKEETFPIALCSTGVPGNGWGFIVGSEPAGTGSCGAGYTTGLPSQGYMYFADGADKYAAFNWRLPSTFVSLVSVTYHVSPSSTSGGNFALKFGAQCFSNTDNWLTGSTSFTDDSIYTGAAGSTAFAEQAIVHTTTNVDSCSTTGSRVAFKVGREGTNGGDTNTNDMYMTAMTIKYTARVE